MFFCRCKGTPIPETLQYTKNMIFMPDLCPCAYLKMVIQTVGYKKKRPVKGAEVHSRLSIALGPFIVTM